MDVYILVSNGFPLSVYKSERVAEEDKRIVESMYGIKDAQIIERPYSTKPILFDMGGKEKRGNSTV